MAATPDQVRDINGSTLDDAAIQPFLDAALCILTGEIVAACTLSRGVSDTCLDLAQAWLAAHLMTMSAVGAASRVKSKERFENYAVDYIVTSFSGEGVMSTTYGQTANELTGGCLAEAKKAPLQVCFFG